MRRCRLARTVETGVPGSIGVADGPPRMPSPPSFIVTTWRMLMPAGVLEGVYRGGQNLTFEIFHQIFQIIIEILLSNES